MTNFQYKVTKEEAGKRIDVLISSLTGYSRQQGKKLIQKGNVQVNDQKIKPSYRCEIDDEIHWTKSGEKEEIRRENIPLTILYEDTDIIVVNKARGMIVHPTRTIKQGTLVNGLLNHTSELSNLSGDERPGIVHRLDQDTSGVLVVAKNNKAHEHLVNQFKNRTVKRYYEAIVHGTIKHQSGIIKAPIGRNPNARYNMTVIESGREAETHFKVLKSNEQFTHVKCELKTGRTHQIRVHMRHIGHPLIGDKKYGKYDLFEHHFLIAQKLTITHPKTGENLSFSVEYPTYFKKVLQKII